MLQRFVIYWALGSLLSLIGIQMSTWDFWCVILLFFTIDYLGRIEGFDKGIEVSQDLLKRAYQLLDQAEQTRNSNNTEKNA